MWTTREAANVRDIPRRVLLIGGSAAGVELVQFYAGMGTEVTIVERAGRLLDRENPRVGDITQRVRASPSAPGGRPPWPGAGPAARSSPLTTVPRPRRTW